MSTAVDIATKTSCIPHFDYRGSPSGDLMRWSKTTMSHPSLRDTRQDEEKSEKCR
jgi:hypothetical protein